MSYLILNAQMHLLKRNLEEVERVVDAFDEGRNELQELLETPPQHARDTLKDVVVALRQLRDAYDEEAEDDEIFALIDDITTKVNEVRAELKTSVEEAQTLARRSPARLSDFRTTLNMELVDKRTKAKIDKLADLQVQVREAMELEDSDNNGEALRKAREAWETFANDVVPGTPEVFGEYVEFLGGLALRYTGFDRGICVIADELMATTGQLPGLIWRSLTLPSREERLSLTHMIGLGFPEWTIWSLPLSVHTLGEAWMQTDAVTRWAAERYAEVDADEDAANRLKVCVADAVATHVVGPAYASALIALRLNPFGAFYEVGHLTLMRARTVLSTLDKLNELPSGKGFADDVIAELRGSWHGALRQAGQGDSLEGREDSDGLTDDEADEVERWVDYVTGGLGATPAFRGDRWASPVLELSAALAEGDVDEIDIDAAEEEPANLLRDVLNAAWHCRLLGNEEERDLGEIDDDAKELWRRLEEASSSGRQRARRRGGAGRGRRRGA